jgi:Phosphotransferase enzyme family
VALDLQQIIPSNLMRISLDTNNVFEYLATLNYCQSSDRDTSKVAVISAKNFNVLVTLEDGRNLLVKQEIHNSCGQTQGEFWSAWHMQELIHRVPDLRAKIGAFLPELIYFDPENSILIVRYLADYIDLYQYYTNEHKFPVEVARSIGQLLATIHSQTFQQPTHQKFWDDAKAEQSTDRSQPVSSHTAIDLIDRLTHITPQVFQVTPPGCLQFFRLYQRFPNLSVAIVDLGKSIIPSCLVHHDLKLNNILIDLDWERPDSTMIRLIDWERANWGDPAFDLGCLLASYLEIWLDGLPIGNSLSINESLQLATTPLELLQPSLFTLVQAYLVGFPVIRLTRPDYLDRAIQFAGLALIQNVEGKIYAERTFDNRGIVILQVAKQLICTPQAAMNTLFGANSSQLITP